MAFRHVGLARRGRRVSGFSGVQRSTGLEQHTKQVRTLPTGLQLKLDSDVQSQATHTMS